MMEKCKYYPHRYISHSSDDKEENVVGMTPAQIEALSKLNDIFTLLYKMINRFPDALRFSADDKLFLEQCRIPATDGDLPISLSLRTCVCDVCKRNVPFASCEVNMSFAVPVNAIETHFPKDVVDRIGDYWHSKSPSHSKPFHSSNTLIRTRDLKQTPGRETYLFEIDFVIASYLIIDARPPAINILSLFAHHLIMYPLNHYFQYLTRIISVYSASKMRLLPNYQLDALCNSSTCSYRRRYIS